MLTIFAEIFCLFYRADIKLISDWLGEMAFPAYLAGRDWSSALSSCAYYGWGLTWIYTPLFLFTSNPVVIWFGYKIINIIIISLISVIIYIIQVRWLKQKDNAVTIIISVPLALLTWIDFGKETTLLLGIWISALLLLETFYGNRADKRFKLALSIITPAEICYVKNFHESAVCLSIIFFLWVVWDYFVAKKKNVYISVCMVSWGLTYIISNIIKSRILTLYTTGVDREIVYNTSAFQGTTLWFMDTWESVKLLIMLIWSNFYTLVKWTYGMAIFSVILAIVIIVKALKKRKLFQIISSNPINGILFYSIMTTFVVILGVAVNWGYGLYYGIRIGGKAFNYARYYLPFFLPALLVCFTSLRQYAQNLKRVKWITFFLIDFCVIYYFTYLYPMMIKWSNSGGHIEWKNEYVVCINKSASILENIIAWILFVMVFMLALFWIKNENKYLLLMTFLCILSISERRIDFDWDGTMQTQFALPSFQISACDESEKAICLLLEGGVDSNDIFLIDSGGYYIYSLQFLLNDIPLQCITLVEDLYKIDNNSIIFSSDEKICEYIGQEYERIQLDEKEYLYVQDVEIIEKINSWFGG